MALGLFALATPGVAQIQQTAPRGQVRDAAKPARGIGVIRGRVVAADSGRPLRRARITITAPELGQSQEGRRTATTNLEGRFEFKDLPAARYRVSVTRGGYLPLDYGQRRPGELGRPLQLAEGQVLEQLDFALPRMGVISGRITDENGEPIEGVSVYTLRSLFFEGQRKFVPVVTSNVTTDDEGEYRINRIPPGTYAVMARISETWTISDAKGDAVIGYVPTYFPGSPAPAGARRLTVGVGQQLTGIDFSLVPGRAPTVSGIAVDSTGRPFPRVSLSEEVRGMGFASFRGGPSGPVASDGTFRIANVPPGEYTMSASRMPGDASGPPEVAVTTIVVEGNDIENIVLAGSSGGTVTGRIISEVDTAPKMSEIRVAVREPLRNQPSPVLLGAFDRRGPPQTSEDGTFTVPNVFGRARFQVTLPEGWMLKSITHQGRDITDAPHELKSGEQLSGVEVLITNRVTTVGGQITTASGAPLSDATVVLFASDPQKWFESSRAVMAARPDQQGHWRFRALPAGEYLIVALDYVEDGAWNDPEYLESLRRHAHKMTLADGGSETVALRLVAPKQ
jgi:hypothetical protein